MLKYSQNPKIGKKSAISNVFEWLNIAQLSQYAFFSLYFHSPITSLRTTSFEILFPQEVLFLVFEENGAFSRQITHFCCFAIVKSDFTNFLHFLA